MVTAAGAANLVTIGRIEWSYESFVMHKDIFSFLGRCVFSSRPWPIIQGAGSRALDQDKKAWIYALDQERLFAVVAVP